MKLSGIESDMRLLKSSTKSVMVHANKPPAGIRSHNTKCFPLFKTSAIEEYATKKKTPNTAVSLTVFKTLQRTLKLWDLLRRLKHISAAWEKFGLNEEKRGEV